MNFWQEAVKELVENILKLPVQIAEFHFGENEGNKIKDTTWTIACGLTIVGFNSDNGETIGGSKSNSLISVDGKKWGKNISKWISQFLP